MTQYIDKDALVAEIERQISAIDNCPKLTDTQIAVLEGNKVVLTKLLSFLVTLEVKEIGVDIGSPEGDIGVKTIWDGDMIVSNKAQNRNENRHESGNRR